MTQPAGDWSGCGQLPLDGESTPDPQGHNPTQASTSVQGQDSRLATCLVSWVHLRRDWPPNPAYCGERLRARTGTMCSPAKSIPEWESTARQMVGLTPIGFTARIYLWFSLVSLRADLASRRLVSP